MDWLQCDIDGGIRRVATTYHCLSSGWYLMVPEDWAGRLTTEAWEAGLYEKQVDLKVDGQTVAYVYAITGENREARAMRAGRQVLRRQTSVVYAGLVVENAPVAFTMEELRSCFRLIVASWNS